QSSGVEGHALGTVVGTLPSLQIERITVDGYPLDNTVVCVSPQAPVDILFNQPVETANLFAAIQIQSGMFATHPVPLPFLSWTFSQDAQNGYHLLLKPSGAWPARTPVQILLTTDIHTPAPINQHVSEPMIVSFVAAGDPSMSQPISSFIDSENKT